jgi:hypothetical protein
MKRYGAGSAVVVALVTAVALAAGGTAVRADSATFTTTGVSSDGTPLSASVTAVVVQDLDSASPTYLQATTSFLVYNTSPWIEQTDGGVTITNGSPVLSGFLFNYPAGEGEVPYLQGVGTGVNASTGQVSGSPVTAKAGLPVVAGDYEMRFDANSPGGWGTFEVYLKDKAANDRGIVREGGDNLFVRDYVESPLAWQFYLPNVTAPFSASSFASNPINFVARFQSTGSDGEGSGTGVVPEPGSLALLLAGGGLLGLLGRRRSKSK